MEKELGTLEMVLEEKRRRNDVFPKLLGLQGPKRTSD